MKLKVKGIEIEIDGEPEFIDVQDDSIKISVKPKIIEIIKTEYVPTYPWYQPWWTQPQPIQPSPIWVTPTIIPANPITSTAPCDPISPNWWIISGTSTSTSSGMDCSNVTVVM